MTTAAAIDPGAGWSRCDHRWLLAAALAAAAPFFGPVAVGLVRQWYDDSTAAYGALVAVAAVVATRQRRSRLGGLPPRGSAAGALALAAALACCVVASLAADVFLLRVSCVLLVAAALWFVCGTAWVRVLLPPLALCLAAIPPPAALVADLTLPLQLVASQLASAMLAGAGMEVVRDGNVLTMSHITLEVVEACSGMRSLVTLFALVAVYGAVGGPPPARVALLAAAVLPVALLGNGLRVAATGLLALRLGGDAARGAVHDATGFAAFALMCLALASTHVLAARWAGPERAA